MVCRSLFGEVAHGFIGLKKENIISYHCTNYRSKKNELVLNGMSKLQDKMASKKTNTFKKR